MTVTAKNVGTGVALNQVTNESGAYSFPVLQPGTYEVSAELPGFKRSVHKDVALPYAGQVRLNFTLEVGAVTIIPLTSRWSGNRFCGNRRHRSAMY